MGYNASWVPHCFNHCLGEERSSSCGGNARSAAAYCRYYSAKCRNTSSALFSDTPIPNTLLPVLTPPPPSRPQNRPLVISRRFLLCVSRSAATFRRDPTPLC